MLRLRGARALRAPRLVRRRCGLRREVALRRFTRSGVGHGEVLLLVEARRRRDEARREAAHRDVVVLRHLVVAAALDRDAVLGPLELRLQVEEVLVRFQVGILLDYDEQSRERVRQSCLRLVVLLEGLRIRGDVVRGSGRAGSNGDAADARARLRDGFERLALVRGVALDGVDEIRDEIVAALVVVLDLTPLRLHGFIERDEVVARRDVPNAADEHRQDEQPEATDEREASHDQYSSSSSSSLASSSRVSGTTSSSSSSPVAGAASPSPPNSSSAGSSMTGGGAAAAAARARARDVVTTRASSASRWSAPHLGHSGNGLPRAYHLVWQLRSEECPVREEWRPRSASD